MNATKVKECSKQLKALLDEQHNALDARVRMQILEIVKELDIEAEKGDEKSALKVLFLVSNFLRSATNIAELISRI